MISSYTIQCSPKLRIIKWLSGFLFRKQGQVYSLNAMNYSSLFKVIHFSQETIMEEHDFEKHETNCRSCTITCFSGVGMLV